MIDGDAYLELVKRRRSTRLFQERPVPRETVNRLMEAAVNTLTSCNRQLWHFVIVTDNDVKKDVSRLGDDGAQSYLYDAPAIIAGFYDLSLESRNPCHTPIITIGMAMHAILLAAEAEGLGAIYLGGIRNPKGVAEAVGAPAHMHNFGLICVGYRADEPPAPNHRDISEIMSYNRFTAKEKRFHPDIRPHLWSLEQLADFRDKLLWYKGIGIDGRTLHVNHDTRFSPKLRYLTRRLGMLVRRYKKPHVLDILSHNGDIALQILNACGGEIGKLYAYDLTPGIAEYMRERFRFLCDTDELEYLINSDPEKIKIDLPDNSVDIISCYERMGQFQDPGDLVREMYRVLKPGGRALVLISNRFYPHMYRYKRTRMKNYALGRNWDFGPERKFEPKESAAVFRTTRFKIASITGLQPVEMKLISLLRQGCARLGWHGWSDWLEDLRDQSYCTRSFTKYTSSTMAYELVKDE